MFNELKKEANYLRILVILLIAAVSIYLFKIAWTVLDNFSDILVILILSWLLGFILEPLVDTISALLRVGRVWATLITYVLVSLLLALTVFLFIPTVTTQAQTLAKIIPNYLVQTPPFISRYGTTVLQSLTNSISYIPSVAQFFFSMFIVLILSFYFIVDKDRLNKELYSLTPKSWHEQMHFIQDVINKTFASFLRVQLLFGLFAGIVTWIVLTLLDINFAASTSLLSGIFAMVPLVGPLLSIIPPLFVTLLVDPGKAIIVFIVLLIAQQIIFNVVGPKLLGNALKVHPGVVILSFLVGIKIAGGIGAILAVPVLGILTVVLRDLSRNFLAEKEK